MMQDNSFAKRQEEHRSNIRTSISDAERRIQSVSNLSSKWEDPPRISSSSSSRPSSSSAPPYYSSSYNPIPHHQQPSQQQQIPSSFAPSSLLAYNPIAPSSAAVVSGYPSARGPLDVTNSILAANNRVAAAAIYTTPSPISQQQQSQPPQQRPQSASIGSSSSFSLQYQHNFPPDASFHRSEAYHQLGGHSSFQLQQPQQPQLQSQPQPQQSSSSSSAIIRDSQQFMSLVSQSEHDPLLSQKPAKLHSSASMPSSSSSSHRHEEDGHQRRHASHSSSSHSHSHSHREQPVDRTRISSSQSSDPTISSQQKSERHSSSSSLHKSKSSSSSARHSSSSDVNKSEDIRPLSAGLFDRMLHSSPSSSLSSSAAAAAAVVQSSSSPSSSSSRKHHDNSHTIEDRHDHHSHHRHSSSSSHRRSSSSSAGHSRSMERRSSMEQPQPQHPIMHELIEEQQQRAGAQQQQQQQQQRPSSQSLLSSSVLSSNGSSSSSSEVTALRTRVAELESAIRELKTEASSKELEIVELRSHQLKLVDSTKRERSKWEETIQRNKQEISAKSSLVEKLNEDMENKRQRITQLQEDLARAKDAMVDNNKSANAMEMQMQMQSAREEEYKSLRADFVHRMSVRDAEVHKLREEMKLRDEAIKKLHVSEEKWKQQTSSLMRRCEELEANYIRERDASSAASARAREEFKGEAEQQQQQQQRQMEVVLEKQKVDLDICGRMIEERTDAIRELEQQVRSLKEELGTSISKTALDQSVLEYKKMIETLRGELQGMQSKSRAEVNHLRDEIVILSGEMETVKQRNAELERSESENALMKNEITILNNTARQLKDTCDSISKDKSHLMRQNTEYNRQIQDLQARLTAMASLPRTTEEEQILRQEMEYLKADVQNMYKELQEKDNMIQSLRQSNDDLIRENQALVEKQHQLQRSSASASALSSSSPSSSSVSTPATLSQLLASDPILSSRLSHALGELKALHKFIKATSSEGMEPNMALLLSESVNGHGSGHNGMDKSKLMAAQSTPRKPSLSSLPSPMMTPFSRAAFLSQQQQLQALSSPMAEGNITNFLSDLETEVSSLRNLVNEQYAERLGTNCAVE